MYNDTDWPQLSIRNMSWRRLARGRLLPMQKTKSRIRVRTSWKIISWQFSSTSRGLGVVYASMWSLVVFWVFLSCFLLYNNWNFGTSSVIKNVEFCYGAMALFQCLLHIRTILECGSAEEDAKRQRGLTKAFDHPRNSTLSRMWQKMDLPLYCCRTSDDLCLRNCFVSTIESLSRIPSTMSMSAAQKNLSKRIYVLSRRYRLHNNR